MAVEDLEAVMAIEEQSYSHPWTRANFRDGLNTGFHIQLLSLGDQLLGYSVVMMGYEEAHLLNLAVHPQAQAKGLARLLLDALSFWAQRRGAECVWLEVRLSHARARKLYARNGFEEIATRKAYYPLNAERREDAIVMKKTLTSSAPACDACPQPQGAPS